MEREKRKIRKNNERKEHRIKRSKDERTVAGQRRRKTKSG